GIYRMPVPDAPELTLQHVHAHAREATGIDLIASGGKSADGTWRRRQMKATRDAHVFYPLDGWNKWDVLAYLKSQGIDAPEKFDVDLSARSVLWLHDQYPEDYGRLLEVFPHAEAIVRRRAWHGVAA